MYKLTQNQSLSLESMRGVSAIMVVLCHSFQVFIARYASDFFSYIVMIAQASVMVFFVLSGFLIGKSIQSNIHLNKKFNSLVYFKSRLIRIYPPLLLSIILVYFLAFFAPYFFESKDILLKNTDSWIESINLQFSSNQIISALTFTNGILPVSTPFNTPLWSLPLEVWYYIIAGLFCTRKIALVILSIFLFIILSSAKYEFFIYSFVWLSGLVSSFVSPRSKLALKFYLCMLCVLTMLCINKGYEYHTGENTIHYYNLFFGLSCCSFIYVFVIHFDKKIKILPSTSKYSYTLYVIHIPIMIFMVGIFESYVLFSFSISFLLAILSVSICMLTSWYCSKFVENKKRIYKLISQ